MEDFEKVKITCENFNSACRICLKVEDDMIDIFDSGVHNQIMEVTKLKVKSNDNLPKTICQSCQLQLTDLLKFIEQAKSTDVYLRSLLLNQLKSSSEQISTSEAKESFKKRRKRQSRKNNKKLKNDVDSDKMYLIVVPNADETSKDSEISIKDLSSCVNTELTHYCRTLVKNHFSDHTYPKEQRDFMDSEVHCNKTNDVSYIDSPSKVEHKVYVLNFNVFKCGDCKIGYESNSELNNHILSHETPPNYLINDYECPVCDFTENDKNRFINHVQTHRTEGYSFVEIGPSGEEIPVTFTELINEANIKSTDCRIFYLNISCVNCSICSQNIQSEECTEHIKSCLLDEGSEKEFLVKYTCPICFLFFFNEKDSFIEHLASHQKDNFYFINIDNAGQVVSNNEIFLSCEEAMKVIKITNEGKIMKIVEVNSCENCDYVSESFDMLCKHYSVSHCQELDKNISLTCSVCLMEWKTDSVDENRAKFFDHLLVHKNEGFTFVKVNKKGSLIECSDEGIFDQTKVMWSLLNYPPADKIWVPELVVTNKRNSHAYTCDLCQEQFLKKQDVINHLKFHQTGELNRKALNYICEKCGKKCVGKINYKKHFAKHLKAMSQLRKHPTCVVCGKTFTNRSTLNGHMKQHIKEGVGNGSDNSILEIICEKCGKGFSNKASLTKHKKQHTGDKENSIYKCEICDRDFFRQSSFDRHKSAHLNPKYFECNICKHPLSSIASLQKHLEQHRNGSNTFDCKTCRLSFLSKDSLTAHQTHTGHYLDRKPLECNVCHEKFYVGLRFTEHIKTHPKYKIGECSLCGKRLSTIQSLMLHMDRHFESNCILCPHCGKQFFEERNYRRHLLTHEGIRPFPCDVENCKKSFYTLFELNRHKKYHNNTRDFRCSYCSKSFHEANHLTVHVRIHTGERPYICPHCNKGFMTRTRCKQHIKFVHQGIGYDLIRSSISKKVTVFETKEAII